MSEHKLVLAAAALAAIVGAGSAAAQSDRPLSPSDFAMMAAASDAYEIDAAEYAAVQSRDPNVRAFAEQMIRDHTQTLQALRQAAVRSGLTPPPMALDDDGQKMLTALQALREPDLDKTYVRQQVLAHTKALVVEQTYSARGSDPNLRQAAQSAVSIIQRHLQMAQQMRATLGGS